MSGLTARLFGVSLAIVLVTGWATLLAQTPAGPDIPAARSRGRVVSSTVLGDGTLEIKYEDGSVRRVPKEVVDAAGQEQRENSLMPASPPAWLSDPGTLKAFRDALHQYYAYRKSGLEHRQRVFEWQLSSSKVIFLAVLILVASGVLFAAVQFYVGLRRHTGPAPSPIDAVTQLDVSTAGIKVSSPVLGVIILVISLAFFYLYLVYVYPISEIW